MVAWATVLPVILEVAPYTLQYLRANAESLSYIGGEVVDLYRGLRETSYDGRKDFLRDNAGRIYDIMKAAGRLGFYTGLESYIGLRTKREKNEYELQRVASREGHVEALQRRYRQYKQKETRRGTRPLRRTSRKAAMPIATLILLALSSLAYFSLVPQHTSGHLLVPISTNATGIVLSVVLLIFGVWVIFRNRN